METINRITRKLRGEEVVSLTVEYHNGATYSYDGRTKKECLTKFKSKFGNFKGFVKKEWQIYDPNLCDYVE